MALKIMLCSTVLWSASTVAAPDQILYNANILVVDEAFSRAEALAIEDGRISAVGRQDEVMALAAPQTRLQDLQGKTVIPGLIDNHIHAIRAGWRWYNEVRLDGVSSYSQALALIAEHAAALEPGEWVTVTGGFVEHQFQDKPDGFLLADLDNAAPDNPVYLQHLFDWGYVNSQALKRIGIDSRIAGQKKPGLLLDKQGLPSGTVTLATQQAIKAALPKPGAERQQQGVKKLLADLNRLGVTTLLDAGGFDTFPLYYRPFAQLAEQDALTVRVHYLQQLIPWEKSFRAPPDMTRLDTTGPDSRWYRRQGVGEQLYMPVQDSLSRPARNDIDVKRAFRGYAERLARKGIHLHLHAVNDESINQHLNQFVQFSKDVDLEPLRWTLAHADGIADSTIDRVQQMGLNIAIHARPWLIGYRFQRQQGVDKAAQLTPMRTLTEKGLPWGLGSDSPMVASMNPFHTLDWAVNGTMVNGKALSQQTVSREQALTAHTRNNARLLFAEKELGSLEPGKRADLVVLDRDYLRIPAEEIRQIKPLATMVDGRWVYQQQ